MNHFAVFGAYKNVLLFGLVLQALLDAGFAKGVATVRDEPGRVVGRVLLAANHTAELLLH